MSLLRPTRLLSLTAFPSIVALLSLGSALSACGASDSSTAAGGSSNTTTGAGGASGATCDGPGTKWAVGAPAFQEATSKWGLDVLKIEGVRFNAIDFDGDGWTDLFVRRGGNAGDDFAPGATRQSWLLRNNHKDAFEDVTETSGIRQTRAGDDPTKGRPGEVVAWGDVDNDGDLDVFTGFTTIPRPPLPRPASSCSRSPSQPWQRRGRLRP